MNAPSKIDLQRPIRHVSLPQLAGHHEHPCPAPFLDLLAAAPEISAISMEYIALGPDALIYPTLPLQIWCGGATNLRKQEFSTLPPRARDILEAGLTSYDGPASFGHLSLYLHRALPKMAIDHGLSRLMVVFMRTATFLLPSQIEEALEEIDGATYASDQQLTLAMGRVRGHIALPASASSHANLKVFTSAAEDSAVFDALFHELTGVTIFTSIAPPQGHSRP